MPFEKVETQVDFPAQERAVLQFWDEIDAFEQLRAKNAASRGGPSSTGPITANNPMGVHHAWGRTYKDAYNRYFAMTGHELRYQNGFDCQGLWVEVEVEKELEAQDASATSRTSSPATAFASIDQFVQRVQGPRQQVRPRADRPVDPPRLLDGLGPHRRRLGEAAGRAASRTSRCRRRTTTRSGRS